jgi:hypothetical protein
MILEINHIALIGLAANSDDVFIDHSVNICNVLINTTRLLVCSRSFSSCVLDAV